MCGVFGRMQIANPDYFKPVVVIHGGAPYIARGRCKFGTRRVLESACKRLQIPKKFVGKTLKDYEKTPENKNAVGIAKWFMTAKPERSLYLFGECGTGKTFLAAIIAQEFIMDYKSVVFGDVPALMEELKRTFDSKGGDSSQDVLDRYKNCDLLILDDIGAGQITEWNVGILYQIINDRYTGGKPMVITSNFDLDGLEARLKSKDSFSATRIVSRISGLCEIGFLGNTDRRRQQ